MNGWLEKMHQTDASQADAEGTCHTILRFFIIWARTNEFIPRAAPANTIRPAISSAPDARPFAYAATPSPAPQSSDVITTIPHIACQDIIDIVHLIDDVLWRICIEDSVQIPVRTESLPYREPGMALWRREQAASCPEIPSFVK